MKKTALYFLTVVFAFLIIFLLYGFELYEGLILKDNWLKTIYLKLVSNVRSYTHNNLHLYSFVVGSIVIMGIYHLVFFAIRNEERCALYFGLTCVIIAVRSLLIWDGYLIDILPVIDQELHEKLEYLLFFFGVMAFSGYFNNLFPKEFSNNVIYIIHIVGLLFASIVLLTPGKVYTHSLKIFQVFTIVVSGYGFYVLNLAQKNGRQGTFVFLVGFAFLFITLMNDILYKNQLVKTGYMIPFGLFIFTFSQAILLSFRFSKTFVTIENQRCKLRAYNENLKKEIVQHKKTELDKIKLAIQLQHMKKLEAITTLSGGIAHQFNNAITVIAGNIELLCLKLTDNQIINDNIDPIKKSINRITQLNDQLLAYAGEGKFRVEKISINDLIGSTLIQMQHRIKNTVKVRKDISPDILGIEADFAQIKLVLKAIISNALEAIDSKGVINLKVSTIAISKENSNNLGGLKPGHYISLRIEDDGEGMDEETRKRVFEPFFSTKFMGRGLGMAAAYGIIKNHHGWISIESKKRKGTKVSFYLPGV